MLIPIPQVSTSLADCINQATTEVKEAFAEWLKNWYLEIEIQEADASNPIYKDSFIAASITDSVRIETSAVAKIKYINNDFYIAENATTFAKIDINP